MKLRPLLLLVALTPLMGLAAEENPPATPKPSLTKRLLHPFGGGSDSPAPKGKNSDTKDLEMALSIEPAAVKLSEIHELKVKVTLTNKSKKLVQLEFPTTQRIEVLVKTKAGKLVEQWSEDQSFTPDPSLVAINPSERLEYGVKLSTRDFVAGESYVVEAFFPNFEQLRKSKDLKPVP